MKLPLRGGGPSDGNYVGRNPTSCKRTHHWENTIRPEPVFLPKQALAHFQAQNGAESEDVGTVLGNLGNIYNSQGKFDQAAEYLGRSFCDPAEISSAGINPRAEHGQILDLLRRHGGRCEEGHPDERGADQGAEARIGPNDSRLRQPLFSLAGKLRQRGDYRQAEQLIQRAQHLPAPDDQLDADPAAEAITCGTLLSEIGRYPEALAQMVRAEKIYIERSKRIPSFQGMIPVTRAGQAEVLLELGQVEKSVQLFEYLAGYRGAAAAACRQSSIPWPSVISGWDSSKRPRLSCAGWTLRRRSPCGTDSPPGAIGLALGRSR